MLMNWCRQSTMSPWQNIWLYTSLPAPQAAPSDQTASKRKVTVRELTAAKTRLIRMVVGLVVATKHHLRAEGGESGPNAGMNS